MLQSLGMNPGAAQISDDLKNVIIIVKNRFANYLSILIRIPEHVDSHGFSADFSSLDDEVVHETALSQLENYFIAINEKFKALRWVDQKVSAIRADLERAVPEVESAHVNLGQMDGKLENLEMELEVCLRHPSNDPHPRVRGPISGLEGKVIDVNYDWNYVIPDLDKSDKRLANLKMTVAREHEFICKVRIARLYDGYAVADILPELNQGTVIAGDRVIF